MTKSKDTLKISEVKGRPMLHWVGKQPLDTVSAFPAQLMETYAAGNPPQTPTWENLKDNWHNLIFHGDNKEVLSTLLVNGFRGKIDLVYIDPPFDSGADYVKQVKLRGTTNNINGEEQSLLEQVQYTDIWLNDNYLQFMYERLVLIRELLSERGNILIHCDDVKNYLIRCLLDEVFGSEKFVNEIIWKRTTSTGLSKKACGMIHDTIYWYSKNDDYIFNMQYHEYEKKYLKRIRIDDKGRKYIPIPTGNPGPRPNLYYDYKGYLPHPNGYKWTREKMEQFDQEGRLIFPEDKNGRIQYKQYVEEMEGVKLQDLWIDIPAVNPVAQERLGYPTQKPESLIKRIIRASSSPNSIVLDCFIGSGTTAAVAQKLGRRWIGCDINKGAIQTTGKRLQTIIKEQQAELQKEKQKLPLEELPKYFLPLCHYRINNYDVQIQHNEFKNLIYEHLGIRKLPSDSFFDGTLGTELVKIVPLNHPLTLLDVQLVRDELAKRRDEERNIVLVSLGKELAVDEELNNYNKLKPINKIRVIELRTDKKYGAFFTHKPAQADVSIERKGDQAHIRINDFISPTIIQRLNIDVKLFTAQIKDFRSQIDCVLIDNNYDGKVFNIFLSDVPEKRNDLVTGEYNIKIPAKDSKIAVKIIDMLGEEVLFVK